MFENKFKRTKHHIDQCVAEKKRADEKYLVLMGKCLAFSHGIIERIAKQWPMDAGDFAGFAYAKHLMHQVEMQNNLDFSRWPKQLGICFDEFARSSTLELVGAYIAKFAACLTGVEPLDMIHRMKTPETPRPAPLTENEVENWVRGVLQNLSEKFNLQSGGEFLRELDSLTYKFFDDSRAYLDDSDSTVDNAKSTTALTEGETRVLRCLAMHSKIKQHMADIEAGVDLSRPTVAKIINRLAKLGLVVKHRRGVEITEKGIRFLT